jgi:A/G-specific adenine glycosylase
MNKLSTAKLQQSLLQWGQQNYKAFPWRELEDPWLALVAEVLLQRTNAQHVEKYFDQIKGRFPTPAAVIEAPLHDLELVERKFGLDRRLKTLIELAEFIDAHDIYPTDYESLTNLYGIGHYTAAAYLSLHMNVRAVLVDANVARWLGRMTNQEKPKDVRRCDWLWELAEKLTPQKGFREYNYAVLDFTMTVCKNKKPLCKECPVYKHCRWKDRGCA